MAPKTLQLKTDHQGPIRLNAQPDESCSFAKHCKCYAISDLVKTEKEHFILLITSTFSYH